MKKLAGLNLSGIRTRRIVMSLKVAFACAVSTVVLGVMFSAGALAQQVEVMVTDRTDGTILVFDPGLTQIGTVTLPSLPSAADPVAIAVNPARTLAAVTNFTTNRVDFLDLTSSPPTVSGSSVNTSPLFPEDVVFSPEGACLVVSGGRPGYVASIDVTNRTLVTSLSGVQSQAVEFIPNNANNIVLTADQVGDAIHVLTLDSGCTLSASATIAMPAGSAPRNITALPDGLRALVSNGDGTIGVLSISGYTVSLVGSFDLPGATSGICPPGSASPCVARVQSVLVGPGGGSAYAYQCKAGNIEVLTVDSSDNVADSGIGIPVSTGTCFLGAEQLVTDGHHLFLSTNPSGTPSNTVDGMTAINLVNYAVTGSVTTVNPAGVAVKGAFKPHKHY